MRVVFVMLLFLACSKATADMQSFSALCIDTGSYKYSSAVDPSTGNSGSSWSGRETTRPSEQSRLAVTIAYDGDRKVYFQGKPQSVHFVNETTLVFSKEDTVDQGESHTITITVFAFNLVTSQLVASHVNSFGIKASEAIGVNAGAMSYECELDSVSED